MCWGRDQANGEVRQILLSCMWIYKNKPFPCCLAMLLLGMLSTVIVKHRSPFLSLGVSTDISGVAGRMHPNCPCGNTQSFPSGNSSLSRDAGPVLDLLIPHWGAQCQNQHWGHVNELKRRSTTSMPACLSGLACMSFRQRKWPSCFSTCACAAQFQVVMQCRFVVWSWRLSALCLMNFNGTLALLDCCDQEREHFIIQN